MKSPLEQFEIIRLININYEWFDISITNNLIILVIIIAITIFLTKMSLYKKYIIPSYWQSIIENINEFILNIIKEQIGDKGKPYYPFLLTIFISILIGNLLGMIPYTFTITTHIIITFTLSLSIFIFVTLLGFLTHGIRYLKIFLPSGTSRILIPLLVVVEIISYFARALSLAIRLAANMMAGHTLLKIIATFSSEMIYNNMILISLGPISLLFILSGLEIAIAFLQTYVFTVLTSSYIKDALELH